MRRSIVIAMFASLALPAGAYEGVELSIRSQGQAAAAAGPSRAVEAPFKTRRDPLPELILREELARRGPRGGCEHGAIDLCYDLAEGRVVYRPARKLMPAFDGLKPENISLRHDRIVFKYSFR